MSQAFNDQASTAVRISIVTETYAPDVNGVANSLRQLIQSLPKQQFRIQIIRTRPQSDWQPDADIEEVCCRGVTLPMYPDVQIGLPAKKTIRRAWQTFQPQLVFIATEGPLGASVLKLAEQQKIAVLSAFHTNFHRYSQYYGLSWIRTLTLNWLRAFHNRTAATLVPSNDSAEFLREQNFQRVHVLPHGVDTQLFHPQKRCEQLRQQWMQQSELRSGLQAKDNARIALYVGRIAAEKNIELLIEAFLTQHNRTATADQPLVLVLVGDGPLKISLQKQYPQIIFAGIKTGEELARYYASADFFAFASSTETFGLVTLEALASGLPVAAFNMAAAKQYLINGENGFTAEENDSQGFVQAFAQLAQADFAELSDFSIAARRCAEQASWQQVGQLFQQHVEYALRQQVGDQSVQGYSETNSTTKFKTDSPKDLNLANIRQDFS